MKKETSYQKLKRENENMKRILSIEMFRFSVRVSLKENAKRVEYIRKCMQQYHKTS